MSAVQGYVKKVNTKEGTGKRGKWVLYSGIIEQDDGAESGWVSFGFEKPPFSEGSYISIEVEKTERGLNYVSGTYKALDPPSRPAAASNKESDAATPATKSGYVDRQESIVYQSSRKDALTLVGLLLEHDALPISASTAKAGQAKRFEELSAYVDKITVQYFHDTISLRKLSEVVDAGAADSTAEVRVTGLTGDDND